MEIRSKKILTSVLIAFLFSGLATQVAAQTFSRIQDERLLERYKYVLKESFPNSYEHLQIEEVAEVREDISAIRFKNKSTQFEAVINSGRKNMLLMALFEKITPSEVPEPVEESIQEDIKQSWEIVKRFKVRTPYEGIFYAYDLQKEDQKQRVYYSSLGFLKDAPY